jgi:Cu/Ag efflux protein CusF
MKVRKWTTVLVTLASLLIAVISARAHDEDATNGEQSVANAEPHHPPGWRFTMPKGDPAKGRAVFKKFECYDCHEVRGENFPSPTDISAPELSQMGPSHPVEFFAESVINPDAVVPKGYRDGEGKSPMSRYHIDKMTLREFIDLTAYIASLKPPPPTTNSVTGLGKIIAITTSTGELVLDHERLEGFMGAMTMGYKVSAQKLVDGLKPGDKVSFTIDTSRRVITGIEKLKQ